MKKYGLWLKNEKLFLKCRSIPIEFEKEPEVEYCLGIWGDEIWMVDNLGVADAAKIYSPQYYNTSYTSPINPYKPEELEVKEITLTWK
jgi:hypothetical protein